MIYGYIRVLTDTQDCDNQRGAILEFSNRLGLGQIEFVSETISSTKKNRMIYQLIDRLRDGDRLVVYELSRLARSMNELRAILVKLSELGVTVHCISQNLNISPDGSDVATHALIFAFSISAQIERQMISDRTRNALAARKAKGLPMGRPAGNSKLDAHGDAIRGYLAKGLNLTAVSKLIDCNRQTLANWLAANKVLA
jgi:DNA invertase Pin-like site-specific DNA recombinase